MNQVIACKVTESPDCLSGLKIIVPVNASLENIQLSMQELNVNFQILEREDIPVDRYFREAWQLDGKQITINMQKAIEIHKELLRQKRKPMLEILDAEYLKAMENQDNVRMSFIISKKEQLRNVTQAPEVLNAITPEELKAAIPKILTETLDV